ncbi:hypothetical protein C8034_v011463 [Colletotrichum sidae]|uniref:N-acetyltransferase domain-containing protein n=1 Tax=Colletotrichum sidae TaxID=1347389 RepID=A0A4R8TJX0_9PEZI|nr:hypothetical protein C8034_v011463 [Colletotrichum sidae]
MPVQMRPATAADGPSLAPVYLSAFHDNPVASTCFPQSSPACREWLSKAFAEEAKDPRAHLLVVTDPDDAENPDRVIAWAKWVRPARDSEPNVTPPPPGPEAWPEEGDAAFAHDFFGGIGRNHARVMGDVRHWYLELVVCHRDHQGRGAASPLLRWGCERVDEDGVVAFLESMPKAKAVYERYGFEGVDRLEFTTPAGELVTQDFMVRKGRAARDYGRVLANAKRGDGGQQLL